MNELMEFHLMIHLLEFFFCVFPEQLQQCFLKWVESISRITFGEIVALDGKTLRDSYDNSKDKSAIHMEACLGNN